MNCGTCGPRSIGRIIISTSKPTMVAGSSPPLMRGTFITSGRRESPWWLTSCTFQVGHAAHVQLLQQFETVDHGTRASVLAGLSPFFPL
jgi:hypothetical protein